MEVNHAGDQIEIPCLELPLHSRRREGKMYTARRKIQKPKGVDPTEFEDTVAQAFFDLENGNQELKSDLKDLYINTAIQLDVFGNRKAVVIHVPYSCAKPSGRSMSGSSGSSRRSSAARMLSSLQQGRS